MMTKSKTHCKLPVVQEKTHLQKIKQTTKYKIFQGHQVFKKEICIKKNK